jgi:hypothetical protein
MNTKNKLTLIAMTTLTLGLAVTAVQASFPNDGSRALQIHRPTELAGTIIPPGAYTLTWARQHGSQALKVSIAKDRRVVATGVGHWIESNEPSAFEAVVSLSDQETNPLSEIRFLQSAEAILIDPAPGTAASGTSSGTGVR